MNVGILTFHDGVNYGAFMQAYSLSKFLKEQGFLPFIINYKNLLHEANENRILLGGRNPIKKFRNVVKVRKFRRIQKDKFVLTKRFRSASELNTLNLDAIIIGADEVWNYGNKVFGCDSVYFGAFERSAGCRLIAYAPSAGNYVGERYPDNVVQLLRTQFYKTAVRDERTKDLIDSATGADTELVVDPVFLPKNYEIELHGSIKYPYLLLYAANLSVGYCNALSKVAKEIGLRIVSVGYPHPVTGRNLTSAGVEEFLGLVRNAEIVVTSMFHGVMFGVRFNKPMIIIDNEYRRPKLSYAVKLFLISDRVVYSETELVDSVKALSQETSARNYSTGAAITHSREWLMNALKGDL